MYNIFKKVLNRVSSPKYRYLNRFEIGSGDLVIDLGANVGDVTAYFVKRGAMVCAYEPNPHAYAVLEKRFKGHGRVILYQAAVSNYTGEATLWLHENHAHSEVGFSQGGSLQKEKSNVSSDGLIVPVFDIAEVLAEHQSIRLLKIDIEGGEYDIIDKVLAQAEKIDYILLETHGRKNPTFAEKEVLLQQKIKASLYKQKIYTDWF